MLSRLVDPNLLDSKLPTIKKKSLWKNEVVKLEQTFMQDAERL